MNLGAGRRALLIIFKVLRDYFYMLFFFNGQFYKIFEVIYQQFLLILSGTG